MLILNKQDSIYAATKLIKYFKDFGRIDDYFRARKIERVKNIPVPIPGMSIEDDMFQDYDMNPQDMNFKVVQMQTETFDKMLEKVASFSPDNAPGKEMKLIVIESLWEIIYSDNKSDMYEANLMRRLTGLLYLDPKKVC